LHNATEIEKRGTPAVAICSEPFLRPGESMAKQRGFPNYRFVLVQHPVQSANPDGIRSRALAAIPQVEAILLGEEISERRRQ
jgi:hypothetical protein